MASDSLETQIDLTIEKPDISQLVGENGVFGKMLCDIDALMDSQYKKGRIKGTDYAKVLSDSIQATIKSATDFVTQKELIAAQSLYYKSQAEKFRRDAILVTSQEIKMKAELGNEVLKGCLTKEQTKTQEEQTLKVKCETAKCTQEIENLKQAKLKLVEDTAISHELIEQTKVKTTNIRQSTLLLAAQTSHEDKKKLVTIEQIGLVANQADHEISKNLNTQEDTKLIKCKTKHECAMEANVKANTKYMLEHALVEHEMIAYTKARAGLEQQRINTELKRIDLMNAQIALERSKLPLICAQAKVELRRADMMSYDAMYKKVSTMVQAKEVAVKKAEISLMCARANVEKTKSYLNKYQALGILEQSKTEQVKREVAKYGILEAKAKAKGMAAQSKASLVNAQLLKQKVKTELAQGKVLEGKLELFAAQYSGLINDGKLRNQKLKDDVRIAEATIGENNENLTPEETPLVSPSTLISTITEVDEVTLDEVDTTVDFEVTDSELPDGDEMPDLTCEIEEEDIDVSLDSIPLSDLDCDTATISTSTPPSSST